MLLYMAYVIKLRILRILRWGDYPELLRWASAITRGSRCSRVREGNMVMEAEAGMGQPPAKEQGRL